VQHLSIHTVLLPFSLLPKKSLTLVALFSLKLGANTEQPA